MNLENMKESGRMVNIMVMVPDHGLGNGRMGKGMLMEDSFGMLRNM